MPKAEIPYTYTIYVYVFHMLHMWHWGIDVFWTPLSPSYQFFLGKPLWALKSDGWIQNFMTRSLNSGFNCPFCRTYKITLVHLHVFYFLSDLHTMYMEPHIKTTHCLFKWCCWLKAVLIIVYWLCILGYLKFYLYNESENGYQ